MAYIYRKVVGGKPYYYLRISKRVNGRVLAKDIAYLGNDISKVQENLAKVDPKYSKAIRDGYRNIRRFIDSTYYQERARALKLKGDDYLKRDLLESVEAIKIHYKEKFLKEDSATKLNTFKNFLVEFAYNTTAMEGNTITLEEANKLLRDDLTPKERSPREIFDLQNTKKVFFELLETKSPFGEQLLIEVHDELVKNIDERRGYRCHDIRVFKSRFDSSPAKYVKSDMGILLKWAKENEGKFHPIVFASIFHQKFEKIHPFADGNGRTGRVILNYMLMKEGFPPLIVQKNNRADYLKNLSKADKSDLTGVEPKHYNSLANYFAKELVGSYWNNFNI